MKIHAGSMTVPAPFLNALLLACLRIYQFLGFEVLICLTITNR
jgi:hypothetical protein